MDPKLALAAIKALGPKRPSSQEAFTLVELMIVVAIIGLLSAAALPQFLNARNRADAKSKIGELAGLAKECSVLQAEADSQSTSIKTPHGALIWCGGSAPVAVTSMSSRSWATSQTVTCLGSTMSGKTMVRVGIADSGSISCW